MTPLTISVQKNKTPSTRNGVGLGMLSRGVTLRLCYEVNQLVGWRGGLLVGGGALLTMYRDYPGFYAGLAGGHGWRRIWGIMVRRGIAGRTLLTAYLAFLVDNGLAGGTLLEAYRAYSGLTVVLLAVH